MKKLLWTAAIALSLALVACNSDSGTSAISGETSSSSLKESSSSHSELDSESTSSSSVSEVILSSSQNQQSSSNEEIASNNSVEYGTLVDSRDNQTYKTVTIGTQTWMAENLNYAYNEKTSSLDSSSFCYNNSADSCSKYGRLYLWSAAMDSAAVFSTGGKGCGYDTTCSPSETVRGVCPEGWHLPSEDEWSTLFTAVGGRKSAGTVLKSTSGWYSSGKGEDSYGFSVLPAGSRYYDGSFIKAGYGALFWSSTEYGSDYASSWDVIYGDASVDESYYHEDFAFSVRCVKD